MLIIISLLAIFTLVAFLRPVWLLYALLVMSPLSAFWAGIFHGLFLGWTLFPTDLCLAALLFVYFLRLPIVKRPILLPKSYAAWGLAICLLGIGIGLLNAPVGAVYQASRGYVGYLVFLPAAFLVSDAKERQRFFKGVLYVYILLALLLVLDVSGALQSIPSNYVRPTIGNTPLHYPRLNGGMLIEMLWLGVMCLLSARTKATKRIGGFLFTVAAVGLLLSTTRGLMVGTAVGVLVLLFLIRRWRWTSRSGFNIKRNLVLSVLVPIFFLIMAQMLWHVNLTGPLSQKIVEAFRTPGGGASIQYRVLEAHAYLDAFLRSPLFGNGFGYRVEGFLPTVARSGYYWGHDEYLVMLVEIGLVGAIPFLLFLLVLFRVAVRSFRGSFRSSAAWVLAGAFVLSLSSLAVSSLTSPFLVRYGSQFFIPIVGGILYSYDIEKRKHV